jgi:hypothetical protein
MNKQTKMIIGVGVVAVAGYLIYKQQKQKPAASFSGGVESGRERILNASGRTVLSGRDLMPRVQSSAGTAKVKPCSGTPAGTAGCGCPGAAGNLIQTTSQGSLYLNPKAAPDPITGELTAHYCCGNKSGDCAGAN